eukprot:g1327.t1
MMNVVQRLISSRGWLVPRRCVCGSSCLTSLPLVSDAADNNVPPNVAEKVGRHLHRQQRHPLNTIKRLIERHFEGEDEYAIFDDMYPVVPIHHNFDDLLIPPDHVSRSMSDTYYVDAEHVLRTHTSAHQSTLLAAGHRAFLATGDVYRRDEIDASHYPVFHQMEGVRVFDETEYPEGVRAIDAGSEAGRAARVAHVESHLKETLEKLASSLYGEGKEMRWVDAYFPFTEPSIELEIWYGGEWLEVLGCGVVEQQIMRDAGLGEQVGWAFGLGLERLAMVLFGIGDIRLFWSEDPRFISQFKDDLEIVAFEPFSKYPPVFKDVSFWLPDGFHENDLFEEVRSVAGDVVEQVALIDEFTHPKSGRTSHCYRVTYRSMERTLTDAEVDEMQFGVRDALVEKMGVELR